MSKKLFVGNLSFQTTEDDISNAFASFGAVESVSIITDRDSGRSKGFGFVEMSDDTASKKAIAELNEATVDGRTIKVMEAKPKEDRPARNFNNGNSYNKNRY